MMGPSVPHIAAFVVRTARPESNRHNPAVRRAYQGRSRQMRIGMADGAR
jgi:hypothetical protein